ncbi:MAG: DUF3999 domain-containing protein [Verrucomicrobiales bacterium]|jgi:hypothetical protein|nr:DUF3999 domain-containing protein [Verrucomicrobiales bacterium]
MNRFIANVLACAALAMSASAATPPAQFRYQAAIVGDADAGAPARVTLTPRLINRTHNHFADLRLFDDADREVPYVLYTQTLPGQNRQTAGLEAIKYEPLADGAERLTFRRPAALPAIDGMRLIVSGADFEKTVLVEISNDHKTWLALATCSVFDYTSRINLRDSRLDTPPTDARFIRLTVSGEKPLAATPAAAAEVALKYKDLEFRHSAAVSAGKPKSTVRVNGVEAWHGKTVQERQVCDTAPLTISGETTDEHGNTVIELGDCNLPLTHLQFDGVDNQYFYRQVLVETISDTPDAEWQRVSSGMIYRVPGSSGATELCPLKISVNGISITKAQKISAGAIIPLDGAQRQRLRLVIINRDNPPLQVTAITGAYLRRDLYFIPEPSRRYTLRFDHPTIPRPAYDLPTVLPENSPLLPTATPLTISEPKPNPAFNTQSLPAAADPDPHPVWQLWLFRALVLLCAAALAFWAWSTLKKMK